MNDTSIQELNHQSEDTPEKEHEFVVSFGPQHPSTHGVLQLVLSLDGEYIRKARVVIGYLHRGFEKLAEYKLYRSGIPLTDRVDYLSAFHNNLVYSRAVEQLCGIEVPLRAQYIRVLMCELNRIASHLVGIGAFAQDLGNPTPFVYGFRDREYIIDLFEEVCGARLTYSYIRPGGVALDLPSNFEKQVENFLHIMEKNIRDYENLLTNNDFFQMRTKNIGNISPEEAVDYGLSGPNARASGIQRDVRKDCPYEVYSDLDFDVQTLCCGDVWSRYLVRMAEIRESISIIKQVIEKIPKKGRWFCHTPLLIQPPPGEVYSCIESPRGELGVYMVSDGSGRPYRYKIRPPSFIAVGALEKILTGQRVADAIAILGSIDIVLGEVDR